MSDWVQKQMDRIRQEQAEQAEQKPPASPSPVEEIAYNTLEPVVPGGPGAQAQAMLDADEEMPEPVPVYDLTKIWGITEEREQLLLEMGIRSPQAIVEFGEKVIETRLSVTETVAKRIIKSAAEY